MRTYWDLTEDERGRLSEEDVSRYVDAELMVKGVLKVKPLVLDPEPGEPEPRAMVYIVRTKGKHYGHTDLDVAFLDEGSARSFLSLSPLAITREYVAGECVAVSAPLAEPEIAAVAMYEANEVVVIRADLERAGSIRLANAKRQQDFDVAEKSQREALQGLWENWRECRARVAKIHDVAAVFAEYLRMSDGSEVVARAFLAKVYDADLIESAIGPTSPIATATVVVGS